MIPKSIRIPLWDLMDAIEKTDGLTEEDKAPVGALYDACVRLSNYIIARNRAGQEI